MSVLFTQDKELINRKMLEQMLELDKKQGSHLSGTLVFTESE